MLNYNQRFAGSLGKICPRSAEIIQLYQVFDKRESSETILTSLWKSMLSYFKLGIMVSIGWVEVAKGWARPRVPQS